jgi:hypothetical protein
MPTDVYACANAHWVTIAGTDYPSCRLKSTQYTCSYNLQTLKKCPIFKLHDTWKPNKKQNYTKEAKNA